MPSTSILHTRINFFERRVIGACSGVEVLLRAFLGLGAGWGVCGRLHAPAALTPGGPWHPLGGGFVWALVPVWARRWGGSWPLPEFEPPVVQPVSWRCATELSRLFYHILTNYKSTKYYCTSFTLSLH
jgi:hypothetical protein